MSNWWANKINGGPGSATPREALPPPAPASTNRPTERGATTNQPHYQRPPQSSFSDDVCPSCSSTNYMAPQGTQQKRCFDCGYPVVQSGSGISGIGQTDGSVKPATQVPTSGYHGTTIIGKVE